MTEEPDWVKEAAENAPDGLSTGRVVPSEDEEMNREVTTLDEKIAGEDANGLCDLCSENPRKTNEEIEGVVYGLCGECYDTYKKRRANDNFGQIEDSLSD